MHALFDCNILIDYLNGIAQRAVALRRDKRLKLPDAVILATALERGMLLVTRNVRDFDPDLPSVRMPYSL